MPLSYGGSEAYIQSIIQIGYKLFEDKFHPIEDFIPLAKYQELLNKCGIVWMNHIRQQGAGNIFAAIYMGKKIILNPQSNLYKTLISWGVKVNTSIFINFPSEK